MTCGSLPGFAAARRVHLCAGAGFGALTHLDRALQPTGLRAWAVALGMGPAAYGTFLAIMGSPLGKLVLFGMTASLFYHLGNGVRHVIWDFGYGLTKEEATSSSFAVFGFAIVATLAVWALAYMMGLVL